jgi:hypothetical protein
MMLAHGERDVLQSQLTFRLGLLFATELVVGACGATACLTVTSTGVTGEGSVVLLAAPPQIFMSCWELSGPGASLLGAGVTLPFGRFLALPRELDFVDGPRVAGLGSVLGAGLDLASDET